MSESKGELPENVIDAARTLVLDVAVMPLVASDDPEMARLLGYASLLLAQCGVTDVGPDEALNAAFYVLGSNPKPGTSIH